MVTIASPIPPISGQIFLFLFGRCQKTPIIQPRSRRSSSPSSFWQAQNQGILYLNLGVAFYNAGDLQNANTSVNQSIILIERKLNVARFQKIDDDIQRNTRLLSTARRNRGIIRYGQNRYQDSIEDFSWVIQHSTEDEPLSYYLRGMAYQAINRQEDACQDYSYAFYISDVSGSLGTRIQEEQKKCLR